MTKGHAEPSAQSAGWIHLFQKIPGTDKSVTPTPATPGMVTLSVPCAPHPCHDLPCWEGAVLVSRAQAREMWAHGIIKVRKELQDDQIPPCYSPNATSTGLLNIPRDGDSTTLLSSLFQCPAPAHHQMELISPWTHSSAQGKPQGLLQAK